MTYERLIKKYGTPAKVRERYGFTKQRMNYWRITNSIPQSAIYEMQAKDAKR